MTPRLPLLAVLLGIGGLLPFLGAGYVTLSVAEPRASQALAGLIAYGAVILAFLGGVHWGFALHPAEADLAARDPQRMQTLRLGLGVVPSLVGWLALILPIFLPPEAGLAVLLAGFLGAAGVESQARRSGLVPPSYMALRWVLTVVVVAVLTTVLVLRLIGAHIIF